MKTQTIKFIALLGSGLALLSACGGKLSGVYECGHGQKITFEGSKMKTTIGMVGASVETAYTLDGKEVKIEQQGVSSTLYTLDENGCLVGGLGALKCCKGEAENTKADKVEKHELTPEEQAEKDKAKAAAQHAQDSIAAAMAAQMK